MEKWLTFFSRMVLPQDQVQWHLGMEESVRAVKSWLIGIGEPVLITELGLMENMTFTYLLIKVRCY